MTRIKSRETFALAASLEQEELTRFLENHYLNHTVTRIPELEVEMVNLDVSWKPPREKIKFLYKLIPTFVKTGMFELIKRNLCFQLTFVKGKLTDQKVVFRKYP